MDITGPTKRRSWQRLLVLVTTVLVMALSTPCSAFADDPGKGVPDGDDRIYNAGVRMFDLIEGNLGSLIMVIAGLLAIIAAAFGAFRSAVSLLVVAVGAFVLRSFVEIFFNFG